MEKKGIKYSIVLPVRNGGNHIKECITSIFSQNYKNFDLLILDNCSTDGTSEWLKTLQDERIKFYPSQTPLSIEENWARIVDIPKREYVTMIGHDDIFKEDFLESIDRLIMEYPEASLWHTHFNIIDASGKEIRKCKKMPERITGNELLRLFLSLKMDLMWTGYIMRSSDYDQFGGLPAYPGLLFADFELLLRLASASFLAVSNSESFSFRVHQSATSTAKDSMMQSAVERFVNFLAVKQNETQELSKIIKENSLIFLDRYTVSYSHRLLRTPLEFRDGLRVQDLIEKSKEYATKLGVNEQHQPENLWLLRIANLIDKSSFLRNLFLLFKRVWKKPVLH